MENLGSTGENEKSLLEMEIQTDYGVEKVNITKESLDWVIEVERKNIEDNPDFFMQNLKDYDKILDTESLISVNKGGDWRQSHDADLSLIRKQKREVKLPFVSAEDALIWGIKVLNFVRTGINTDDVKNIKDFSESFKEIYERRLSELEIHDFDLEKGISNGRLWDTLSFSLEREMNYYKIQRYHIKITNLVGFYSVDLEGDRYQRFLAMYEPIFELIEKTAELKLKGARDYTDLEPWKQTREKEAKGRRKADSVLSILDSFLKQ